MIRFLLIGSVLVFVSAASGAADIHKCATPAGVTYQGTPCDGPEVPTSIVVASAAQAPAAASPAKPNWVAGTTPDCDPTSRRAPLPSRNATICIGMTDDEVLNLAGWGRPAKIVRTRVARQWREQWIYDTRAAGLRYLHFVNGKLALLETEPTEPGINLMARLAYD